MEGKRVTSREVFRKHISINPATNQLNASGIFGTECFTEWLGTRTKPPMESVRAYHSAVRNVVTGSNGAMGFSPEEEVAVLACLRTANPNGWPCFEGKTLSGSFGWKTVQGYNEKKKIQTLSNREIENIELQEHHVSKKRRLSTLIGMSDITEVNFDLYDHVLYSLSIERFKEL